MAENWDVRHGLMLLLEAINESGSEQEPQSDLIDLTALLAQVPAKHYQLAVAS